MRTIKFRGKSISHGEWKFGSLLIYNDNNMCIKKRPEDIGICESGLHSVNPATVGQFSGLLDKNGREIYEGDIIHAIGSLDLIVKWDDGNACFFADYDSTRNVTDDDRDDYCPASDFSDYYVVGSIHSNPELLKTE